MKNQTSLFSGANFNFRAIFVLCCALLLSLSCSSTLQAQVTTASVRGTVTDEQKAALAGAEVTITNVGTSYTRSMQTGTDGEYDFPDLPLGTYRIHVTPAGFHSGTQPRAELHATHSRVAHNALRR